MDPSIGTDTRRPLPDDLRWLQRLAQRVLQDPGLADDACQETFLTAHRRQPGWQPPRPWLAATLRRIALGLLRATARRRRREREAWPHEPLPSTAELVARGELQGRLCGYLLALPEPFRTTALLHFQDGWPVRQIALQQQCPEDSVRWRLRRAIDLMRRSCERELGSDWRQVLAIAVPVSIRVGGLAARTATIGKAAAWSVMMVMHTKTVALVAGGMLLLLMTVLVQQGAATAPEAKAAPAMTAGVAEVGAEPQSRGAAVPPAATAPQRVPVAPPPPTALLAGRVLDEAGNALGAEVRAEVPEHWHRQAATAADGGFELAVPVDPLRETSLRVQADPFHTSVWKWFQQDQPAPYQYLGPGRRDLGTIVLRPAGALYGRVQDQDGKPLAKALVHLAAAQASDWTAADGSFAVEHVRAGKFTLHAEARNQGIVELPVEVRAGEAQRDLVITLRRAGTLSGTIVDEHGVGVAGVHIGTGAGFTMAWTVASGTDGRFDLALATAQPTAIDIEDPRYRQLDCRGTAFEPGTAGIRVTVRAIDDLRLRVVDAQTGAPVQHFAVTIARRQVPGGDATRRDQVELPAADHADGVVDCPARAGIDEITIAALGYRSWSGTVRPDADSGLATIHLESARRLTGRIVSHGHAVAGVQVAVHRCWFRALTVDGVQASEPRFGGFEPNGYAVVDVETLTPGAPAWDWRPYGPQLVGTATDADGRFAADGIDVAQCCIVATPASGPPLRFGPIRLDPATALGDLELPDAVTVAGRIELAVPGDLAGHRVEAWGRPETQCTTDAAGRFAFETTPGDLVLVFHHGPGLMLAAFLPPQYFARATGARTELVVPVTNFERCDLTLRTGCEFADYELALVPAAGGETFVAPESLDKAGSLSTALPAVGSGWLELRRDGRCFRLSKAPVACTAGSHLELEVAPEAGDLAVRAPSWPRSGSLDVNLRNPEGVECECQVSLRDGALGEGSTNVAFDGTVLTLQRLPAGSWSVTVRLCDEHGAPLWQQTVDTEVSRQRPARVQ